MGLKKICNFSITLQLFKYKFFLKIVNSVLRVLTLERGVAGSPQSRTPPALLLARQRFLTSLVVIEGDGSDSKVVFIFIIGTFL